MKVLCLHGSYGSAKAFRTQLDPFVSKIEVSGDGSFKFVDGQFAVEPPEGFTDYFGPPPHYRNIDFDGIDGLGKMIDTLRDNMDNGSNEDTLRHLLEGGDFTNNAGHVVKTFARIKQLLDEDLEIDGILGYSEGATAAASYLLHEAQQEQIMAFFFAGWPPFLCEDGKLTTILADESEVVIDVPTCHIVGSSDPYLYGAMALYAVCDEDNATLFDHGKGHTVPRDQTTIHELVESIRTTVAKASA
ncbi:hypothetical protein NLG97_g3237 [Lecanicillium saksenae]|uniref:Uncharacterized protein n=1 Tax=Lecanicillium saksenae TaxID=468837 RepID=A0ACC1QYN2_9HYPO|nr:hypothetical protein NLG97_g3237 [Lecanicillium saksenae]